MTRKTPIASRKLLCSFLQIIYTILIHYAWSHNYYVPNGFIPKIASHGNSKCDKPFYATLPSTAQLIKSKCSNAGPKEVVASVSSNVGGIVGASYPGELPRNEDQVSKFKKRKPCTGITSGIQDTVCNDLYTVMLQAHLSDQKFSRDIKAYPEPAIIIANERQLNDVARFCCNPFEFSVLTVDPTFSLGDFDVTPTTYRHLLLVSNRSGKSPVMIYAPHLFIIGRHSRPTCFLHRQWLD